MMLSSSLNWVAVSCVFAAFGALLIIPVRRRRKRKQLLGLQWLQALCFFLKHVQKHRGLSVSFLSGNWDVESDLLELKRQISSDISAVVQLGEWINFHQEWLAIVLHWAKLGNASETLGFSKSFSQHSKLIANILVLLDQVAAHHQIREAQSDAQGYASWHRLLLLGELVGQCRALGVRMLGMPSQDQQLEKYKKKIEKLLKEITLLLAHLSSIFRGGEEELANIQGFIEFVNHNLVANVGIISAHEYFDQATRTTEAVYKCLDSEMQNLHRKIAP